jgi:uncharacterized protein (UPF0332 family)
MNPREFQTVAEDLLRAADASHNRAAIGRAYYAVFNVAAELLRNANFNIPRSAAGHLEVTRLLKASENEDVMRAGSRIEDMRGMRNRADYDMTRKDVERDATAALLVADARRCIDSLDASFSGSSRASIITAMQGWLKRISAGGP